MLESETENIVQPNWPKRYSPISSRGGFADWLLFGLKKFYQHDLVTGQGDEKAFPEYPFSVGADIASQFRGLYDQLDDRAKAIVRNGLSDAIFRAAYMKFLYTPYALVDLRVLIDIMRIGLDVAPRRFARQSMRYLPNLRWAEETSMDAEEQIAALKARGAGISRLAEWNSALFRQHIYQATYLNIIFNLVDVNFSRKDQWKGPIYATLNQEYHELWGKSFLQEAIPPLGIGIIAYEKMYGGQRYWASWFISCAETQWPKASEAPVNPRVFETFLQNIGEIVDPSKMQSIPIELSSFLEENPRRAEAILTKLPQIGSLNPAHSRRGRNSEKAGRLQYN